MTLPRSIWSKALRSQLGGHQLTQVPAQHPTSCYIPTGQRLYSARAMQRGPSRQSPRDLDENESDLLMELASGKTRGMEHGMKPKALERELEWLQDPRALADRVGRLLNAGDVVSATALFRHAHKERMPITAAWNRLMQYCMDRYHWKAAYKFYNDMKKRGVRPNEVTFTILLQGLRRAIKVSKNPFPCFEAAQSIYRSIFAPNSPVTPNVVHANAMLSVCDAYGDMDALWRIAGELPEKGDLSPDMTTYSIILGAIQYSARADIEKIDARATDMILARKAQMVKDGKRIWIDVLHRWTKDQMPLDSTGVSTMANLLLDGATESSYYDVLALYHQTMGIPILASRPQESNSISTRTRLSTRTKYRIQSQARDSVADEDDVPFVNEVGETANPQSQPKMQKDAASTMEEEVEENFDSLFDPVTPGDSTLSLIQPGNKELTMIVEACSQMTQATSAGFAYWNHLTLEETPYRVDPDPQSVMVYLRFLRHSRSSKRVVQVMQDQVLPSGLASGKLFHVAFSVCRRDKNNMSILSHANDLLGLMGEALVLPDPRALEGYLQLVQSLSEQPQLLLQIRALNQVEDDKSRSLQSTGKLLQVNLRLSALSALWPHIEKLLEALEEGRPPPKGRWNALTRGSEHVLGQPAVKIINWTRLLIDDALQAHFSQFLPKKERKVLESKSEKLRMFSDTKIIQKFSDFTVYPSRDQHNNFLQRQAELRTSSEPKDPEPAAEQPLEEKQEAMEAEPSLTS